MEELIKLTRKIAEKRNDYWLHDVVFTYQWWLLLGLTILPWILWWKLADKKRIIEILLYGIYTLLGVVNKWFVERWLFVGDSPPER